MSQSQFHILSFCFATNSQTKLEITRLVLGTLSLISLSVILFLSLAAVGPVAGIGLVRLRFKRNIE